MATNMMTRCETKRRFKINGVKESRWVDVAVADIVDADEPAIRCSRCHGAVKLIKKNGTSGSEDHVKHRFRQDTDNCAGVGGAASLSSRPVD